MKQKSVVFDFPTESIQLTLRELLDRNTSSDADVIKNVSSICKWWCETNKPLEISTSGSTGHPKNILFERTAIKGSIDLTAQAFGLREGMTALLAIDPSFVGGKMMIIRCIEIGMKVICFAPVSNPMLFLNQRVDFAPLVPLQVNTIIQHPDTADKIGLLKIILIGGAPLSPVLRSKIEQIHSNTYLGFGMTETLSHIALQKIETGQNYFKTLPGISIGTDERGCLFIEATHLGKIRIQSNDLVEIKNDNQFHWIGRYDRVINSGGIKLFPEVMEEKAGVVIETLNNINGFYFCPLEDHRLGQKVVLVLTGSKKPEVDDLKNMLELLKAQLERYEFPKAIYWSNETIKNQGGKLDRKKTLEQANCIWPISA